VRQKTGARLATTLLLLPLAVAALSVGPGAPAHAIANGQDAADGEYPFAVKLTMTGIPVAGGGVRNGSCSGALVAPQWVITAGHCFRNTKGTRVSRPVARLTTATVGRTDLTGTDGHEVKVVAVRQSPTTDVALAKIATPITDIEPVQLSNKAPKNGAIVRLAGYGLTNDNDKSSLTSWLQTGQFKVVSVSRAFVGVSGKAPRASTSACLNDSGGPYFTQSSGGAAVLVSVVSGGPSCPHAKVDRSGRIDPIRGWISGIVGPTTISRSSSKPTAAASTKPTAPASSAAARTGDDKQLLSANALDSSTTRTAVFAFVILGFAVAVTLLIGSRRRSRAYPRKGVRRHRRR